MSHRLTDRLRGRALQLFTALTLVAITGCGKGATKPVDQGSSTYTGTVTGETVTGTLTVTIATSDPATADEALYVASGTFTPAGGAAIALTGSYDTETFLRTYILEGAAPGQLWQFTGELTSWGGFRGECTDDMDVNNGVGFTTLVRGEASDVITVLGSYLRAPAPVDSAITGRFNFVFDASGQVRGDSVEDSSSVHVELDGTHSAGTFNIAAAASTEPVPTPATGTYTAPNAVGTWNWNSFGTYAGNWTGVRTP